MFEDRIDAGKKLADELNEYCKDDCIVVGIPRGGVVIAKIIGERLGKAWDMIVPRKIGAPFNKEVAIGAVTQDGTRLLNHELIKYFNISDEYIDNEVKIQMNEIKRRLREYRGNEDFPDVYKKTVILVDDGLATGFTAAAAVNSIKKHGIKKMILGVPVASVEAIDMLRKHVDEIICIEVPNPFLSVGSSYLKFEQNTDEQIIDLFKQNSNKMYI